VSIHLFRETSKLKKLILDLGGMVEERVRAAVESVSRRDAALAEQIIEGDMDVDRLEVEIEEECLKTLALYQPVAMDLRFVVSVLKINNDLERTGDIAVNIAERAIFLAAQERVELPFNFPEMSDKTQKMLHDSLDALVNMDAGLARAVCKADEDVDAMHRKMYAAVKNAWRKNPSQVDCLIHLLSISRHLERIADHATNIAEDVIYMIEGEIVRHRTEDFLKDKTTDNEG
jgi:phosphate transport system protein